MQRTASSGALVPVSAPMALTAAASRCSCGFAGRWLRVASQPTLRRLAPAVHAAPPEALVLATATVVVALAGGQKRLRSARAKNMRKQQEMMELLGDERRETSKLQWQLDKIDKEGEGQIQELERQVDEAKKREADLLQQIASAETRLYGATKAKEASP
mmetsp:Transcript_75259/g.224419  ORF Transcript_75259/g.224419 Transcript_75259/m.224419 type:complete len:159 (+) Transcript_75259:62-538(+)